MLAEPAPEITSLTSSIFLPVSFSQEMTAADTTPYRAGRHEIQECSFARGADVQRKNTQVL